MRTGTVSYKLEDLRKGVIIPIGMVGENDFTRVIFDAEEVFKKHPDAQVTMKVQPPKGGIYPATVTRDGNAVIWQVKAADVAHRGSGELQLTFTDDTMVEKSYIARTDIKRSLVGNGPAPDPVQDWVDNAEEVLDDLEAAEAHQPIIGLDGYWYTWNQGTGEYEKTNTKAQGQDGHSPVLTSSKSGKTTTIFADGDQLAQILDGEDGQGADVIDDTAGEGDTDKTWSADKLDTEITDVKSGLQGVGNSVDNILDHETYTEGGASEYTPVTPNTTVNGKRSTINGYGYASISEPTSTNMIIYPVEIGKTYKVKGYSNSTNVRPLLIVADSVVTSGGIANPGTFDYVLGTNETAQAEEKEYTALRTGYLYINSNGSDCGLWLKNIIQVRKYHMDNVLKDLSDIDSVIDKITRAKIDSSSAWTKVVPRNAEPVARVTNIANTVTTVRSILSRNVADKNAVDDVEIDADHTMKKGIKTVRLPAGRYYVILGNVGAYTMVKRYENGVYSSTMYKEQFPMKVSITDPGGGCFIVYASSVSNLGDLSGLCIARLHDDETTLSYDAYSEKTYTPEELASNNRIEVVPNGIIEFVNSGNTAVASTVEYTVFGKDDDTTTRKDFIISPDGTKFLPMIKNDGSVVGARVIPKKAFFIGNSLTSGWQTFGEAATESDKDFVARFSDVVSGLDSDYTFSRKWSTNFEQKTSLADAQTWVTNNIDPLLSSDLDLIVVQLCENVVDNASAVATFPESSMWLLQHLRTECPKARVVWMGVWFERGWVKTLLENTANTGCEYVDIRQLYLPENVSVIGTVYKMESDYTKEYTVDSFTVNNGQITLVFTVDGVQHTATIPSYTSYTSSSDTSITVTGIYHVVSTYYAAIHPGDEGFRKIANKLLFDLGISDSEETIPADT
ncbi:hypothetical protein [Aristaeella lactis]|uniref:Uncharacterized protein n=1 Tax=Aristaeella lactis TaxID=3046383 RepID=A0AC61PID2_9FIRM|nr:hypothetical protein [Aristaeella lactis]QUA53797.1 hypothetical protein JYE50_03980 [Aristaeella lactis]SMC39577.1 hypothetical protein SAMN06297397_0593 [Aristaeella lactis]